MKCKLESLKNSKYEMVNSEQYSIYGGGSVDYSMKYETTYGPGCDPCSDEEAYDMCVDFNQK